MDYIMELGLFLKTMNYVHFSYNRIINTNTDNKTDFLPGVKYGKARIITV